VPKTNVDAGCGQRDCVIQRLRVPLGFVVAAIVLYLAKPQGITILAGLPFAVAGAMLRGMSAGVIRKDSRLATVGPYAWTRNPLYFGSFLLTVGFAIMSASWVAAAVLIVPSVVIYPNVIRNEEAHLERLFPEDFRRYCASVPRFFPKLGGFERSFSFKQYWANREYNTALGFAVVLAVFVLKWLLI
jgi:protein-S-isoprenylcysteine O-methyltransferase Ste14